MAYAKINSDNTLAVYPYTSMMFRDDNNNTKPPTGNLVEDWINTDAAADGSVIVEVVESDKPTASEYQIIVETNPVLVNDNWTQQWALEDKSAEEIEIINTLRNEMCISKRNMLLQQSDFTQLGDVSLTDEEKAEAASYRQALRDLGSHSNWPALEDNDWPTRPAFVPQT